MNCKEVFNIIIHVQVKFDTEIIDLQCVNYIVHTIGYRNNRKFNVSFNQHHKVEEIL